MDAVSAISPAKGTIVTLGDSITDGYNAVGGGPRWTVSAGGSSWTTLARVTDPDLRDVVPVGGEPVRYVWVGAHGDATATHPLVVGRLMVQD